MVIVVLNFSLVWIVGILVVRFWLLLSNELWIGEVCGNLWIMLIVVGVFGLIVILFFFWSEVVVMVEVLFFDVGVVFFEMLKFIYYGYVGIVVMVLLVLILIF